MAKMSAPDFYGKRDGFTDEEKSVIRQAKEIIEKKGVNISHLEVTLMRDEGNWGVLFNESGHRGPGGGWSVALSYPERRLVSVGEDQ